MTPRTDDPILLALLERRRLLDVAIAAYMAVSNGAPVHLPEPEAAAEPASAAAPKPAKEKPHGQKAYWAQFTPEEREAEMKRRIRKRMRTMRAGQ